MATFSSEKIVFTGSQGDALAARLDLPDGPPIAYALFAHCFTCSKDVFAASRISRALATEGIAVLRFDFTGLGMSGGDFANTGFSSNVEDLVRAADWLREHHEAPKILIGHSLGGAAVLAAAHRVPESVAVSTIGAPSDPGHVERHIVRVGSSSQAIEGGADDLLEVEVGGRPFRIRRRFLDDIAEHTLTDAIAGLRRALLVFHGWRDSVVGIDHARRIFDTAKHPKSFVSLDEADHLVSRRPDATYIARVLAAWASRYVGEADAGEGGDAARAGGTVGAASPAPDTVTVVETGEGKFRQRVTVGRHVLAADEPASVGGDDTGPSPYDYLLVALGACTAMTLRLYADRKKLPVERVSVDLSHEKIHAEDCDRCETQVGKVDRIERVISIEGDLDDEQRARLLEIADKCPVHRTLESETLIVTRAAGPARD
jgi:uncharacterized OsmC-like protein/alpha/beta superfamily hydrolase